MLPIETDRIAMWMCRKYGVKMMAAHAAVFCARRFAAANGKDGIEAAFFEHCRTCARGAAAYDLNGSTGRRPADRDRTSGRKRPDNRAVQVNGVHGARIG